MQEVTYKTCKNQSLLLSRLTLPEVQSPPGSSRCAEQLYILISSERGQKDTTAGTGGRWGRGNGYGNRGAESSGK